MVRWAGLPHLTWGGQLPSGLKQGRSGRIQASCVLVAGEPRQGTAVLVLGQAEATTCLETAAHGTVERAKCEVHFKKPTFTLPSSSVSSTLESLHFFPFHGLGYPFIRGCAVYSLQ
jgi:hypothetical protein